MDPKYYYELIQKGKEKENLEQKCRHTKDNLRDSAKNSYVYGRTRCFSLFEKVTIARITPHIFINKN